MQNNVIKANMGGLLVDIILQYPPPLIYKKLIPDKIL